MWKFEYGKPSEHCEICFKLGKASEKTRFFHSCTFGLDEVCGQLEMIEKKKCGRINSSILFAIKKGGKQRRYRQQSEKKKNKPTKTNMETFHMTPVPWVETSNISKPWMCFSRRLLSR